MAEAFADFDPVPGAAETLMPGVRRILAPNPSPMTFRGTNTYLIGEGAVAVIDPGPEQVGHLEAILAALGSSEHVSHILVTHSHRDHSPLARPLAQRTGAPILAFGDAHAGRSQAMQDLVRSGLSGGGEGVDADFVPDQIVVDGEIIEGDGWALEALHTPGHFGNHLSFALGDVCFTGDHVMGWASSLVSPPDGDLTDFMASCKKLAERHWTRFFPGHGAPIEDPQARLRWLIDHRLQREQQIMAALAEEAATAQTLTRRIYTDVAPALLPAAERNVLAHLVDLHGRGMVSPLQAFESNAVFEIIGKMSSN